ncbi:MAG: hypothetical protein FD123_441 [Bacteroidetes bacterium]|nr:MAG: hypothetical protein FD123_441 [Bacteroidota bacterium]
MSKFRLDIEYDYDFILIGISCHEKDYRLCWAMNQALSIDMARAEPLQISLKKEDPPASFSLYAHENPENDTACFIVGNRSGSGLLVPEQKHADYFFTAKGPFGKDDEARMLQAIKNIPFVLTAFALVPAELKSKQNLVF